MNAFDERELNRFQKFAWIVYILYSINAIFPPSCLGIVGVIMAYILRWEIIKKCPQLYLMSHFNWQIRTFWFSLLGFALGILIDFIGLAIGFTMTLWAYFVGMTLFYVGIILFTATYIWYIYRLVRGMIRLVSSLAI